MKDELRKEVLDKRKTLNCSELSGKILKNLFELPEYGCSKNIICYYPLKYEADTKECFKDGCKNWFLPRVNGQKLEICPFCGLKPGAFGILEPQSESLKNYSDIDMIIIPACAADIQGFRLGWGKGYYDRFLPELPQHCIKAVLVYSELLYKTVYPDKYDIKADIIVTDKEILRV